MGKVFWFFSPEKNCFLLLCAVSLQAGAVALDGHRRKVGSP
jgi:hypothetical protein